MYNFTMKLSFLLLVAVTQTFANKKLICYYGTWATYRHGNGQCNVEHIDPFICTHLVYTFVGLDDDYKSVKVLDSWLDLPDGRDNMRKFNALKQINPDLITLLAIGGWGEGSRKYSVMANDPNLRAAFVQNALSFVQEYGFDGFDVDWEYPGRRDTVHGAADVQAFVDLLRELKDAFAPHGLLVTAAVAAVENAAKMSYDIPAISESLDIINIMAYDLHGAWDQVTGHNAGLYPDESVAPDDYNVEAAVDYWLAQGAPAEKLTLGMPLYARTFMLANLKENYVGSPANGPGIGGPYTSQNGIIGYNEICEKRLTEVWEERWDALGQVPYALKGNSWITFDNPKSLKIKTEYLQYRKLGGAMVWSIETDDFRGICHSRKFELLSVINEALGRDVPSIPSNPSTVPSPPPPVDGGDSSTATPGETPSPDGICSTPGYVRDPNDCGVFYLCVQAEGKYAIHRFTCPIGLVWDTVRSTCNYRINVDC